MKPRSLLCCLIVCRIKMELSSQISDISGDLIPQQLFGIQQGSSAFFLGLFFPLSLVICSPCWQELPVFCLSPPAKQTQTSPRIQELLKCGGEKRDECRNTKRFDLNISKGSKCQIFAAPPQPLQLPALHFPFSYPHSETPSQEKESGFWE